MTIEWCCPSFPRRRPRRASLFALGINLRGLLNVLGLLTALDLSHAQRLPAQETTVTGPNIVFIMADDLGYGDLGCFGQKHIRTPRVDRMAAEGTRFTQCYAGAPVCAPSRSVLMTGQHTGHTRVRENHCEVGGVPDEMTGGRGRLPLEAGDVTVAEVLKSVGYVTGMTGKWGLGEAGTDGVPTRQGFDEFFGYLNQNHAPYYYTDYLWRNEARVPLAGNQYGRREEYAHDLLTGFALDFIRRHRSERFFLYVPYTIPHFNFEVPGLDPYATKDWPEKTKIFAAMITRMDRDVGRILDLLDELQLAKDTVVFFCSDNGGSGAGGPLFKSSGALTGHKGNFTEGGIRTPMVVRWPGNVPAARVSDAVWYFADVLPTLAALTGATPPQNIDGVNVLPALLGSDDDFADRFLYWEKPPLKLRQAVRWRHWKALRKLDEPIALYDLTTDTREERDVAGDHPEIVARFEAYLKTARTPSPHWPARASARPDRGAGGAPGDALPSLSLAEEKAYTNSIGMRFVRVEKGKFRRGASRIPLPEALTAPLSYPRRSELERRFPQGEPAAFHVTTDHVRDGDFDEQPRHDVAITRPFLVGIHEVTNAQYERFDPDHRLLRGKNGFSNDDEEAVVFVSWYEAEAFCRWLSEKEGRPYRLPTEAEWEYVCRAGTRGPYATGDALPQAFHKNQRRTSFDEPGDLVSLHVGKTPASAWGVFDMHGNVEEWCADWYGPYRSSHQTDPVGRAAGDFKVTRGGSHGTGLYYLRSANRMGTLPENRHWLIGFRVVLGSAPTTKPEPALGVTLHDRNVSAAPADWSVRPDPDAPYFEGPRRYVRIPGDAHGPLFGHHNHDPAITYCPNGDLLAIWYTCVEERGRELAVAASRLRRGASEWQPASPFWDAPDRNDHCPALWTAGDGTLYHFNGLSVAGKWEPLAILLRTSQDSGATWSKARLIAPEHGYRSMVGEPIFRTRTGAIVFGADAGGGSTVWVSHDGGLRWEDRGGTIHGIHAGIVELSDGRLMALGRGRNIDGWMPKSLSDDLGRTWRAEPSVFPPLSGGQRAALLRLQDGALFFASFARDITDLRSVERGQPSPRHVSGIFGALSYDDGVTWPVRRWVTSGDPSRGALTIDSGPIRMSATSAEPQGYLSVCQAPDGVIHLISSINHYAFNTSWLNESVADGTPRLPETRALPRRDALAFVYDGASSPAVAQPAWESVGDRREERLAGDAESPDGLRLEAGQRWTNERRQGFETFAAGRGFTLEIAARVDGPETVREGLQLVAVARGGALTVNQYRLSVSPTTVSYYYDNAFRPVAIGLDNSSALHVYRLAVRDDTAVQIYRDGKLLATMPKHLMIDWRQPARGSFCEWGAEAGGVPVYVRRVAYDVEGAFAP